MARYKRRKKRRISFPPFGIPILFGGIALLMIFQPRFRNILLFPSLDHVVLLLTTPLQSGVTEGISSLEKWGGDYLLVSRRGEEIRRLEGEIAILRSQSQRMREMALENLRLREMLQFEAHSPISLIAARVVGHSFNGRVATLHLNRGEKDGVRLNSAVVTPAGVVGQVWVVNAHSSEVLTIVDQSSSVDARVSRSRGWGILEGLSDSLCQLNFVRKSESVEMGDEIVTSGLDGVYPGGLLLGTVIEVQKDPNAVSPRIWVHPVVDITKLEEVFVHGANEGMRGVEISQRKSQ